jgi:hypothetical protein
MLAERHDAPGGRVPVSGSSGGAAGVVPSISKGDKDNQSVIGKAGDWQVHGEHTLGSPSVPRSSVA